MDRSGYIIGQIFRSIVTLWILGFVYFIGISPFLDRLNYVIPQNLDRLGFRIIFSAVICVVCFAIIARAYRRRAQSQMVLPDWGLFLIGSLYDYLFLKEVTDYQDGCGHDTIWHMTLYGSNFEPIKLQGQNVGYHVTIRHYKDDWSKLIIQMSLTAEEFNTFCTYRERCLFYNFQSVDIMLSQNRYGEIMHACARIKPLRELRVSKHPDHEGLMRISAFGIVDFRTSGNVPATG